MKRKLKVIAAIFLVLIMFVSAMPMQLTAEVMTLPLPVMQHRTGTTTMIIRKLLRFFEQMDENSVRNGEKLSEDYDPTDSETYRLA